MNIVVNTIPLLSPLTGIGRYTYEISKRLDNATFYYGYFSKKLILKESKLKKIIEKTGLKRVVRKLLKSPKFSKKFDLYWEPNFIPIDIEAKKIVTTVHDFSFLNENWHNKERIKYFKNNFFKNIKKSDFIITDSEYVKAEVIEYIGIKPDLVKSIYLGVDHDVFYNKNLKRENFILFVGSIEPRKNLINLLKAYDILPLNIKENFPLYLAGFNGWNNKEIMNLISKNQKFVKYFGYVSLEELVNLYNKTSLFVYPSLYEGFGIPPLEAMACGAAVLVSNVSSLPEIYGEHVFYCDPYDIENISYNLEKLLEDEKTKNAKIQSGLNYVKNFNWDKSAEAHREVFRNVYGR